MNKTFYKKLLILGVPIVLQSLIVSAFQLVDNVMIGQLGENPLAGVALANQIFFVMQIALFGIASGCAIFTSQFYGKGDESSIRQTLSFAVIASFVLSLLFFIASFLFPEKLMSLYSKDTAVIAMGANYLRVVAFGFPFFGISLAVGIILRSIENVVASLLSSSIALVFNAFFNWVLIFGVGPFPEWGVLGAAVATAGARGLDFLLILLFAKRTILFKTFSDYFHISKELVLRIVKKSLPVLGNEVAWVVGVSVYSAIYGRESTETIVAYQIAATVMNLFFVVFIGMGSACATMLGNRIGSGETETANKYAEKFLRLSLLGGVIIGAIIAATAYPITGIYNVSPEVRLLAVKVLLIYSLCLPFKSSTLILVVGVFRSGGDTTVAMLMDIIGVWFIGIPLAIIGFKVFHFPLHLVYLLICFEEAVKFVYGLFRLRSKKWLKNITYGMSSASIGIENRGELV